MKNPLFISLRYALISSILGPVGLPPAILPPLFVLLGAVALGFIGIGIIIFFLTGGGLFLFPMAWIAWVWKMLTRLRVLFYNQRRHVGYQLPVILTFLFLLPLPLALFFFGFEFISLYVLLSSFLFATITLRNPDGCDFLSVEKGHKSPVTDGNENRMF